MKASEKDLKESSYIHEKSDIVPDWVSRLEAFKSKIRSHLHSPEKGKISGVTFCHPISVPNQKK